MTRDIDSPDYRDSNAGEGMIPPRSATPKPRAGEHVRWADQYDFDKSDPATRLFVAASNWVDRCEAAEAERDLLREREKVLVAAIEAALAYCESEAIGTVQQEIADNERMCQTLRNALEYGR